MEDKIKQINLENQTIFIYFILLTLYLYANKIEINYLINKDDLDKEKYRNILLIVFGISTIITLCYTIQSINDLKNIENYTTHHLKELSAIASILILIASIVFIYIIYKDENIDLEISP